MSYVLWPIKEHSSIRNQLSKRSLRRRRVFYLDSHAFHHLDFTSIRLTFSFFLEFIYLIARNRKRRGAWISRIRSTTFGRCSRKRKVFPSFGENCVRMVNGRDDGRSPSANLHKNASTVWRIKWKNSSVRRVSPTKRWYLSSDFASFLPVKLIVIS